MNFAWLRNGREKLLGWGRASGKYVVWGFVGFVAVFAALELYSVIPDGETEQSSESGGVSLEGCNVIGLNIHGCIGTYAADESYISNGGHSGCDAFTSSEDIMGYINHTSENNDIRAILLDIDSGGGEPQAAVEVADALKMSSLPSVAWIRGMGDSAAYWIASAADTIVASKVSDVGSIGVTSSYVDNAKQNIKEGLTYNSISTGKYKDMGNPDKPLTAEERRLAEKQNATILEEFIRAVAENRTLPLEKVRALADGSSMLGEEALSNGLVDSLGAYKEALATLKEKIHEEPVICWPQVQ